MGLKRTGELRLNRGFSPFHTRCLLPLFECDSYIIIRGGTLRYKSSGIDRVQEIGLSLARMEKYTDLKHNFVG